MTINRHVTLLHGMALLIAGSLCCTRAPGQCPLTFAAPINTSIEVSGLSASIRLVNLNGDSFADLVTSNGYVIFGTGTGTFQPPIAVASSQGSTAGDLNGDGRADIISAVFAPSLQLQVLINTGTGAFRPV